MHVFVAAKFEEKDVVRDAYAKLRAAGHEITRDWTVEDDSMTPPAELAAYHAECAAKNLDGVRNADVLIIFPHERSKDAYVELGAALALQTPVLCVTRGLPVPSSISLRLPQVRHVASLEEAIERMNRGFGSYAKRTA